MTDLRPSRLRPGRPAVAVLVLCLVVPLFLHAESRPATAAVASAPGELVHWAETNGGSSADQRYTRAQAVAVARRYEMVSALRWTFRDHVGAMKKANPRFRLMIYNNGAFAKDTEGTAFPSGWYLRDARGRKVRSVKWGNYLMNPASRGWQDQVAAECRQFISFGKGDGCHLDDLGWGNHISDNLSARAINPATGKPYTERQWLTAAAALAARVDARLPAGKLVGANGLSHGGRWFAAGGGSRRLGQELDYGMAEGWLRGQSTPLGTFRDESAWKRDVDMLVDAGRRGLTVATMTKIWRPASDAAVERWRLYAQSSFLLGTDGDQYFFFNAEGPGKPPAAHRWDDLDLGRAKNAYRKAGGVYTRAFAKGRVFVNPTGATRTVDLGGTATTITGTRTRRLTLGPNTGMVVFDGRPPGGVVQRFRDVPAGSTFAPPIERIADAGITRGCNKPTYDLFCPDDKVTRQQMATFLAEALDLPPAPERFRDVGRGNVFAADIGAIAKAGITRGCNPPRNDRFCPKDFVTRQQMAAFLANALELSARPEPFRDVRDGSRFAGDIGAIARAGVTRGCNPPRNDRFCPREHVKRKQMAAFIVNAGLAR